MKHTLILGAQWGDEGKGKIVDTLMKDYDICVRFNGGNNAGHTIYRDSQKIVLHTLPTGILTPDTVSVIGHGVLVNPIELFQEIQTLRAKGYSINATNLKISPECFMILNKHKELDKEREAVFKIGTTLKGISPAIEDKVTRKGFKLKDLLDINKIHSFTRTEEELDEYYYLGKYFVQFFENTMEYILRFENDHKILFESAQGIMLDLDYGNYPFVTSTNCGLGGVFNGAAPIRSDIEVIAVFKPYITYVGEAKLDNEITGELAAKLQFEGQEYGSTTGRLRRVAWLDLKQLDYAIKAGRIDKFIVTKVDIFDKLGNERLVKNGKDTLKIIATMSDLKSWCTIPIVGFSNGPNKEDFIEVKSGNKLNYHI